MKNDCLFCAIAAGEIPSNKVYEDELCYAFRDIAPQALTHFLVIPKAHIASVSGINAENSAVVAHIFEVIAKVTKEIGIESYRVVSNIGEQAGQSVPLMAFIIVDLPAPFLPITPSISPFSRLNDTFLSAQNSLFLFSLPMSRRKISAVARESRLRYLTETLSSIRTLLSFIAHLLKHTVRSCRG